MSQQHEEEKITADKAPAEEVAPKGGEKTKKKKSSLKMPDKMPVGPGNFWNNILSTVLFLIALSFIVFIFQYIQRGSLMSFQSHRLQSR
jgi:cellobiose-specific phosphotransferase system component IIC